MNEDAERDQNLARLRDNLPKIWWALYDGCKSAGFASTEALELVKAWIKSQGVK